MLSSNDLKDLFDRMSRILERDQKRGEICLVGGAAMVLCFNARPSTRDADGIFEPKQDVFLASLDAAAERPDLQLEPGWLNSAADIYAADDRKKGKSRILLNFPALLVWTPDPRYILAMKVLASRVDSHDPADIRYLINELGMSSKAAVLALVDEFLPSRRHRMPEEALAILDEIFEAST